MHIFLHYCHLPDSTLGVSAWKTNKQAGAGEDRWTVFKEVIYLTWLFSQETHVEERNAWIASLRHESTHTS